MHELRKYRDKNNKWWVTNDSLLHYAAIDEKNADFLLTNFLGQSKSAKNIVQQRISGSPIARGENVTGNNICR